MGWGGGVCLVPDQARTVLQGRGKRLPGQELLSRSRGDLLLHVVLFLPSGTGGHLDRRFPAGHGCRAGAACPSDRAGHPCGDRLHRGSGSRRGAGQGPAGGGQRTGSSLGFHCRLWGDQEGDQRGLGDKEHKAVSQGEDDRLCPGAGSRAGRYRVPLRDSVFSRSCTSSPPRFRPRWSW